MSDDAPAAFAPPAGVPTVTLAECANCWTPTPEGDLVGGVCGDCITFTERALAVASPPPTPEAFQLDIGQDELASRRELRKAVQKGADPEPRGWLQHATEHVRAECTRGRTGHEFTIDTILDHLEEAGAPMPPQTVSMRFVMEQAITRGWCEATDRTQAGRRDGDTTGKQVRVYRSTL